MKGTHWLKRAARLVLALLALSVASGPLAAWGQEQALHDTGEEAVHPEPHEGTTPVPWNDVLEGIVNFAIFVGLLYYFLRKPAKDYLEKRSRSVYSQLEEAAAVRRAAEEKLEEYRRKLEEFERERQQVLENYRRDAHEEQQVVVEEARRHAERIRQDAKTAIEYDLKRARAELRERIVGEAVRMARGAIEEKLDQNARDQLVREYTEQLARVKLGRSN